MNKRFVGAFGLEIPHPRPGISTLGYDGTRILAIAEASKHLITTLPDVETGTDKIEYLIVTATTNAFLDLACRQVDSQKKPLFPVQ